MIENIFRKRREDKGLTINKVAELVGITSRKLYRIEEDSQQPLPVLLSRLCKVLRISLKDAHDYYNMKEVE